MGISLTVGGSHVELEVKAAVMDLEVKAANVELNTCIPGPAGPPGPAGGAGYTLPTEVDLGGNRAIATDNGFAVYADSSSGRPAIGISTGAVSGGEDVVLQSGAKMVISGAGWTPGLPIFTGLNGVLTQVEPTSGFSQYLGMAHDSETIIIEIAKPINLA